MNYDVRLHDLSPGDRVDDAGGYPHYLVTDQTGEHHTTMVVNLATGAVAYWNDHDRIILGDDGRKIREKHS